MIDVDAIDIPLYTPVRMTWLDTMSYSGWRSIEEHMREIEQPDEALHCSVGFFLGIRSGKALITQSMHHTQRSCTDVLAVPIETVMNIEKLIPE